MKTKVEKSFAINDGVDGIWPLSEMLETNYSDPEFCEWAKNAKAGDEWVGVGEKCTCIGLSRQHGM
jgi:hypothetical protein